MTAGEGLTRVSDAELEGLLRALYKARFELPLTRQTLLTMGLHGLADHGSVLIGLDARGLKAVLVAVLAERRVARGLSV
ncbi:MAG: hypothetical protein KF901_27570 [Myxococcales bacterium]|nr:hypothetical protein [Myxococcales bacterium]